MRLPLPTDLNSRDGSVTKDAKMQNCFAEGEDVLKRPAAQGGIAVGTGTAQGGIGFMIGSTPYFIGFWADTMQTYTGSGTSWNSGTSYLTGAHVTVDFEDYWALVPNTGKAPSIYSSGTYQYWSKTNIPARPSYYSISTSASYVDVLGPNGTAGVPSVTRTATLNIIVNGAITDTYTGISFRSGNTGEGNTLTNYIGGIADYGGMVYGTFGQYVNGKDWLGTIVLSTIPNYGYNSLVAGGKF